MKTKQLSGLEQEVMNIVWDLRDCSVREVLKRLERPRKLAYTTVATILQRLYDKGLVARKGVGQVYSYSPKVSKESYSKKMVKNFLNRFFGSFGDVAIASFVESVDQLPKEKREYLLKLLKK